MKRCFKCDKLLIWINFNIKLKIIFNYQFKQNTTPKIGRIIVKFKMLNNF